MKLIGLDSHPLIEQFRKQAGSFQNSPNEQYHLLLPPEYNIPAELSDPQLYLFVERSDSQGTLTRHGDSSYILRLEGSFLYPQAGFDAILPCEILQTTPCTTTAGFSFDMHEVIFNPLLPSPIPPLCTEIQDGFDNPDRALTFLKTRIRSQGLPAVLQELETFAAHADVTPDSLDRIVSQMQSMMDKISETVFFVKPFHFIPTIFKMRTNFIVFYAVTNLFHAKLLPAYHLTFEKDNQTAQRSLREQTESIANPAKLREAAAHISRLHFMTSIYAGIEMVRKFFAGVMEALPNKNAAADDILPAVCDGMQRCTALSSRLVSSFQYLADVWPTEGLDERITYILVTCSIAASHFASGQVPASVPTLGAHKIDVHAQQTEETIRQLEDLLHNM